MNLINSFLGKQILVIISGVVQALDGVLIEIGQDVIVIKNLDNYLYIPTAHIKYVRKNLEGIPGPDNELSLPTQGTLTLETIVENGKGIFTEIFINGVHPLHGYIQKILSDYLVFHSPIFGTILVHLKHLKYLHPYPNETRPYALKHDDLQTNSPVIPAEPTFTEQLKKMEGKFIMIDLADQPQKVGLLKSVHSPMIELVTSAGQSIFSMIEHIQTVNHP